MINENNIICEICHQTNKNNVHNKQFYKCFTCNKNLCPLCQYNHDSKHKLIDYDKKNYVCEIHNDSFFSYCEKCKINLCLECKSKHNSHHRLINYDNILPDEEKIKEEMNTFRTKIGKLNDDIKSIIDILKVISQNIEIYYKINDDLLKNYEIKKRNYYILTNLNSIQHNINIRDIDKIINTNDINYKFKHLYIMYEKITNKYINKVIYSNDENSYDSINYSLIHQITLKNQVNKIINAYRNYKKKIMTKYINENNILNIESVGKEYLDYRDSLGKKQGFGIQKMKDGSRFCGIFSNDKVNGWGIYKHKNGDIYRGQYVNDKTNGYGEYSHSNGAIYYGYWINDMQFGVGYEIWNDSSQYSGEYNNGKKEGIGTYIWADGAKYRGEWKLGK